MKFIPAPEWLDALKGWENAQGLYPGNTLHQHHAEGGVYVALTASDVIKYIRALESRLITLAVKIADREE